MLRTIRVIAVLIAAAMLSVVMWQRFLDPDLQVKSVTSEIEREIPAGSTKAQVYEFLEAGRFKFTAYDVGPDPLDRGHADGHHERKRYLTAWLPVRGVMSHFCDYDRTIVFYFDEHGKLSDYSLQRIYHNNDSF